MKVQPTLGSTYSGSMKGITAGHNKGGLYFRGRAIPTNPNTARQQSIRAIVGGLSNTWSNTLTEAQRQAWRDYAANVPVTDSIGNTINLSGFNWFVKVQAAVIQANDAGLVLTSIPSFSDIPVIFNTGENVTEITQFDGIFTVPPGTVQIAGSLSAPASTAGIVLIYVAPPQTAGTRFYKGPYQLAASANFVATAFAWDTGVIAVDGPTTWVSDTIPVAAWDTLFIPLKAVAIFDDGRRSEEFRSLIQFTDQTP